MPFLHPVSDSDLINYGFYGARAKNADRTAVHVQTCKRCASKVRRYQAIADTLYVSDSPAPSAEMLRRAKNVFVPLSGYRKTAIPRNTPGVARLSWARGMLVLLMILVAVGTLLIAPRAVSAAMASLPGDSMYGLKIATEKVQVWLAPNAAAHLQLSYTIANTRLEEIEKLTAANRYEQIPPTAAQLDDTLQNALLELDKLERTDPKQAAEFKIKFSAAVSNASIVLSDLVRHVPPTAVHAIELAISRTQAVSKRLGALPNGGDNAGQTAAPTPNKTPDGKPITKPAVTAPGQQKTPPGSTQANPGNGDNPPGNSNNPPGNGDNPPGNGGNPPGNGGNPPGNGGNPPGNGGNPPGNGGNPPGNGDNPPGNGGNPPGNGGNPPGNGGNPPNK